MARGQADVEKINVGLEDEMRISGYRRSIPMTILMWFLVILSGGTLMILLQYKPSIKVKMSHVRCSLDVARTVLLQDSYDQDYVEVVIRPEITARNPNQLTYFYNKKHKYIWQRDFFHFIKVSGLELENCASFHESAVGLSSDEVRNKLELYSENSILIDVKPVHKLVLREVTSPFYIYQMFIVVVWLIQVYYQFSLCIVFLSIISISATVWETRKQSTALRDTVHSHSYITVIRDGIEVRKSSHELVPGDVLMLHEQNFLMECDAILVNGSCVVNESMLTGESIPITKLAIANDSSVPYSPINNKKNTLFCGTQVLQTKPADGVPAKAIVYRTGFSTVKGDLVRTILFPKPVNFKLYRELFVSMIIFLILGIPAMVYTAVVWHQLGTMVKDTIIIVVDVATFVIPPLLPAVMTSINAHAQRRLRKHDIFCLNSRYINFCGGLDVVCFDKTGTLTEDSLDLSGVVPVFEARFQPAVRNLSTIAYSPLIIAMTTCHSLTKVNGVLMGYTLDVKMFEAVGWELEEPSQGILARVSNFDIIPPRIVRPKKQNPDDHDAPTIEVGIVRQYPFESLLQRMTVVTKTAGSDHFEVYMKGAPEVIYSFSTYDTVPDNFYDVLEMYTRQGFRVLAVGVKRLPSNLTWEEVNKLDRAILEEDMEFQGLLVLQNKLKEETTPALRVLKNANIKTVMVTGDNLLTAISVARDCGMVNESDSVISVEADFGGPDLTHSTGSRLRVKYTYAKLPGYSEKINVGQNGLVEDMHVPALRQGKYHLALDGKTFNLIRIHDPILLKKIVHKGIVFARMLPEQKLHLIEALQHLGHQVGMCGDGANDCGALKTAHAGISLSVAEASVAAPFTSKKQNIQCIPTVIREGRATLASTFGAFRYMVTYCFVLLSSVLFMFWDGQKPSDGAYVIIDIVLGLFPPIIFGSTHAFPGLAKRPPTRSILSFIPQFSIITFIMLQIAVYILAWKYCISQPWYEPFEYDVSRTHSSEPSHLGTTILCVNMMSYVIAAVIFAPGPPYRKDFFSNKLYLSVVVVEFLLVTYLTIYPAEFLKYYVNLKSAPHIEYHLMLFGLSMANFIFCYLWETLFIQYIIFENILPKIRKIRGAIYKFEKLEEELNSNPDWPPVGKGDINRPTSVRKRQLSSTEDQADASMTRRSSSRWIRKANEDSTYNSWNASVGNDSYGFEQARQPLTTFVTFQETGVKHNVTPELPKSAARDSFV